MAGIACFVGLYFRAVTKMYHKIVFKRSKASHLLNLLKVVPHHVVVLRSSKVWVVEEIITQNLIVSVLPVIRI